ncbi:SGNH/GDSL hydrolase family protein [Peribacillus sp. JNUCC 23]
MKKIFIGMILLFSLATANITSASAAGFVAFGDSNTAGSNFPQYGYDMNLRWVVLTGAIDAGVSGNNTNQAMNRFKKDVLDRNPNSVSIMFGQVDQVLNVNGTPSVSKAQFESNLNSMVDQLQAKGVNKILLMTNAPIHQTIYYTRYPELKPAYEAKGGVRLWANSYNEIIRKVAKEQGVILVDHYANAWVKAGGGAGSDAQLSASGLIDPTGTHWTPSGHNMMTYSINYYLSK